MIPGYMEDEYARLRAEGSALKSGAIDRSGNLEHPALAAVPPAGGALQNAAPPVPPTGQAQTEYPPAPSTQASSQGLAGAALSSGGGLRGGGGNPQPVSGGRGGGKPVNTTRKMFEDANPLQVVDALDASAKAMKNTAKENPQAFKQMDAALTLKGIDTKQAFYEMRDNLMDAAAKRRGGRANKVYNETEFKKRWKNVFNIIPEDQMGMFLFDFGLRMLAASSSPGGAGTHAGMAGMGALGGVQARQQRSEDLAMKEEEMASEQAGALIGMEQQQQQIGIQGRQADTAEQARIDEGAYRTEQNRLKGRELDIEEKNAKLGIGPNGERREFSHEAMLRNLESVGYSRRDALDMINGAPTEAQRRMAFAENFHELVKSGDRGVPPGSTQRKKYSEWTDSEKRRWIESEVRFASEGGGSFGGEPALPERPKNWDKYPSKP